MTESIENIPAGWRARETYVTHGPDEFEEIFELAEPGKPFVVRPWHLSMAFRLGSNPLAKMRRGSAETTRRRPLEMGSETVPGMNNDL